MHWNHRIVKKVYPGGIVTYGIHETHYNDAGEISGYTTEPVTVLCESLDALRKYVQWMLEGLDKPVLIDGEVEFCDATAI
jgi:tetrahydromethanopterin S-methyltransferase subunit H